MLSVYYVLSWIPQMVAELGFTPAQAARVSVTVSLGGMIGTVAMGWASHRAGLKRLVLLAFCGAAVLNSHL